MLVTCPLCGAQIEAQISSLHPQLRWGTSGLPAISGICQKVKDGSSPILPDGSFNCLPLEQAVEAMALRSSPS
jgi:hypothetical protein